MTDIQKLAALLDEWGVPYRRDSENGITPDIVVERSYKFDQPDTVSGYYGFYTAFEFDDEGKFIRMGAWE